MTPTARMQDTQLRRNGLRYWAPGPVVGTLWALDNDNLPRLVDDLTATPVVRHRCQEIADANAHPDHQLVYELGAYAYGLVVPNGALWWVVPFDWSKPTRHIDAGAAIASNLEWEGMS